MGLPSHPGPLSPPGFLPGLAVVPAHIAPVNPIDQIQLFGISPQNSINRSQYHLCIIRNGCFFSILGIPYQRSESKRSKSVLNTTYGEILQRIPQCIPTGTAVQGATKFIFVRHTLLLFFSTRSFLLAHGRCPSHLSLSPWENKSFCKSKYFTETSITQSGWPTPESYPFVFIIA